MVVRMRSTRSHTKNRRSHHGLENPTLSTCTNCGASHRPHHMCLECGFYNGRQVFDLKAEKEKRDARIKAKQDFIKAQSATPQPETNETVEPVAEDPKATAPEADTPKSKKPEKQVE